MLCDLRIDIQPEAAVHVLLRGCHFSQPALVLLDRLCLVRKDNLRVDHDGENPSTTSSRSTPGNVASGKSFKLMKEYSKPPIFMYSSSSSSMFTFAIWLRALW